MDFAGFWFCKCLLLLGAEDLQERDDPGGLGWISAGVVSPPE